MTSRRVAVGQRLNNFVADKYGVHEDDEKVQEIWVTDVKEMRREVLSPALFQPPPGLNKEPLQGSMSQ